MLSNKHLKDECLKESGETILVVSSEVTSNRNELEISASINSIKKTTEISNIDPNEVQVDSLPTAEQVKSEIQNFTDNKDTQTSDSMETPSVNIKTTGNKKKRSSAIVKGSNLPSDEEKNIYVQTSDFVFRHYDIRLNSFTQQIEGSDINVNKYRPVTDRLVNSLVFQCNKNKIKTNKTVMWTILNTSQKTHEYNPLKEYLDTLPEWNDGKDYIGLIAERIQVDGTPRWKEWFTRYFVAMVASGLQDEVHNEMMLILYGKQSVGKTTFLRNLIPPQLHKYFYSGIVNPANEEFFGHLSKFLLINIDELVGMTKKAFRELKEFLSKKVIHHRIKYDKFGQDFPRRATFAGTTNDKEFLFDLSGNRRFICVEAIHIDYHTPINLDMAYSQAYSLVKEGTFQYWFDQSDVSELESNNKKFLNISPEQEKIVEYFQPCEKGDEDVLLTATEIAETIFFMKGRPVPSDTTRKIGSIMTRLGFQKKKKPNGNQAYCVRIENIDKLVEVQTMVSQVWGSS